MPKARNLGTILILVLIIILTIIPILATTPPLPFKTKTLILLASLLALYALITLNNHLTRSAQNNWVHSAPWRPSQETALVTGGSSGIGRQIVADLAGLGLKAVVVWDVKKSEEVLSPNVHFYKVDVTSPSYIKRTASLTRKAHGDITILINNAGVAYSNPILNSTEEETRHTFDVNVLSHFWTVKEFLPAMLDANHGHVVTMASMASFVGSAGLTAYAASKAALLGVHEGVRQEAKHFYGSGTGDGDGDGDGCESGRRMRSRVRTSIIHPLYVTTPMTSALAQNKAGERSHQPFLTAEDVSTAVVKQLVSGDSGQVVVPPSHGVVALLRGVPGWVQELVRDSASKGFLGLTA
ncbi:uncharacterized protein BDV17DRAFT_23565 [Aspergillus undulatus]|uniref:uncharacterized protein n=1 Tax=Aspergillus undulatus TaxID=1810928 RepID=UPI003CCCC75D